MQQQTLKAPISFSGKGLHTGKEVTLTILPADVNTGYVIRRSDLNNAEVVAYAERVEHTNRCTTIVCDSWQVSTIEHAFSALYAMGVTNCILEVDGPEFPILNGSATPYVTAINEVGIQPQNDDCVYFVVKKTMEVYDDQTGARILLLPSDDFSIEASLEYNNIPQLNKVKATFNCNTNYATEIAPARSFVLLSEVLPLLEKGLVKGGSLSNALIISDRELSENEKSLFKENFPNDTIPSQLGFVNPSSLGENEPARHKILDIIGDLALSGCYIQGRIIAFKPGHGINNKLARLIRNEVKQPDALEPHYDPSKEPILTIEQIKELLPHRYPFLLVDKVVEIGKKSIVGVKCVTGNEPFFIGHFPQEPVMPGVLIIEAMAQTGGLLVINSLKDQGKWSTYLLKIDKVKFRRKVVPGDTLVLKLRLLTEIRRGIAVMRGLAYVGGQLVCEAEFTAQIVKAQDA